MDARHKWRALGSVLVALAAVIAVGCGGSTTATNEPAPSGGSGSSTTSGGSQNASDVKIGLVTDVGGLNDRSFNSLANQGLEQAKSELGIQGTVLESKSNGDYVPNLSNFAQQQFNLIIGVGYLMGDTVGQVASKFPDAKFAVIDHEQNGPNVRGLLFKEQEAGYLAGALAGMVEQDGKLKGLNPQHVVSSVGGASVPAVNRYIAGFQAGVKAFCKDCKTLNAYSGDFVAPDKCKEQALTQISQGSDIVFQVAGGCGLGALDAAKSKGVWGIGVDADQSYLGPHILTSATKHVDKAVTDTIKSVIDGSFAGGQDTVFGLDNDGVGLGEIAAAASAYEAKLQTVIADIKAGKITIPTDVGQ